MFDGGQLCRMLGFMQFLYHRQLLSTCYSTCQAGRDPELQRIMIYHDFDATVELLHITTTTKEICFRTAPHCNIVRP